VPAERPAPQATRRRKRRPRRRCGAAPWTISAPSSTASRRTSRRSAGCSGTAGRPSP